MHTHTHTHTKAHHNMIIIEYALASKLVLCIAFRNPMTSFPSGSIRLKVTAVEGPKSK